MVLFELVLTVDACYRSRDLAQHYRQILSESACYIGCLTVENISSKKHTKKPLQIPRAAARHVDHDQCDSLQHLHPKNTSHVHRKIA